MFLFEQKILDEFGYTLQVAGEIEFYISPGFNDKSMDNQLLADILFHLSQNHIAVKSIGFEVAPNQFEISFAPKQPEKAVEDLKKFKFVANKLCEIYEQKALFDAKPFDELPGSGLHIHISLHDKDGKSLYRRISEGVESQLLLNSVGGLCETMLKNFTAYAPSEASYKRYTFTRNQIAEDDNPISAHNNAPVNVSWGGNNRTVAIRIPTSTLNEDSRHIEFRVAGADADPSLVVEKIIEGIYFGIKNKITPQEKTYGNAYDAQYSYLVAFPKSLDEAIVNVA
jgi:glutamine synthetase